VEVRGLEPSDVIKYARSDSPNLETLAAMLRSLDWNQLNKLVMNGDKADIEIIMRALKLK